MNANTLISDSAETARLSAEPPLPKAILLDEAMLDTGPWQQVVANLCAAASMGLLEGGTLHFGLTILEVDEAMAMTLPGSRAQCYVRLSVKGVSLSKLAPLMGMVTSHGGFLQVSSQLEGDAEFEIYLPEQTLPVQASGRKPFGGGFAGHGEAILLVDDEESVRVVLVRVLRASGYQVFEAKDGAEGLKQLSEHLGEVKVIISDLIMPIMDGSEFVRAAHQLKPSAKVITVSGLEAGTIRSCDWDNIVQTHLTKPFGPEEMLRALQLAVKSLETAPR